MTFAALVRRWSSLDWLELFLVSWIGPLAFDAWHPLTYATSLCFWLVPTILLLPRFLSLTDSGGRRRRAFLITVAQIVGRGVLLDFGFGARILYFSTDHPEMYLLWLGPVPIEEVLFYVMGPVAILLVYVWSDEYWMAKYNPVEERMRLAQSSGCLLQWSWGPLLLGLAVETVGLAVKHRHPLGGPIPLYLTYLVGVAFSPAAFLFSRVAPLVNWRAFAITFLYLLITSMVWEPVLALPRGWWWYRDTAMMGLSVQVFARIADRDLPLEAVLVWIAAPFSCVLTYETVKGWQYRKNPTKEVYRPK